MFRIVDVLMVETIWIDNQFSHGVDVSDTTACPRVVLRIDQEDGLLAVGQEVVQDIQMDRVVVGIVEPHIAIIELIWIAHPWNELISVKACTFQRGEQTVVEAHITYLLGKLNVLKLV